MASRVARGLDARQGRSTTTASARAKSSAQATTSTARCASWSSRKSTPARADQPGTELRIAGSATASGRLRHPHRQHDLRPVDDEMGHAVTTT